MWVDWWLRLMNYGYEMSSLHMGIDIKSNIYIGLTHNENTTYYIM